MTIAAAPTTTGFSRTRDRGHRAGAGSIAIACIGSQSVVTRAFASSPLRVLTPRNHGRAAWVYTSTYGGGLVDGDALHLDVDVGPNAAALVATQAATKVYRSPGGTSMTMTARVDDGGLLAALPDPVVCFRGAAYQQDQRIDLAPAGSLVLMDWLTSGRHASGERWSFDRYASRLEIWRSGSRVLLDSVTLDPRDGGDVSARIGRFDVLFVAVLIGPAIAPHASAIVSRLAETPIGRRSDLVAGASEIAAGGCVLRMIGTSVEAVGRAAREHLRFVPALLGDDPWSRKW